MPSSLNKYAAKILADNPISLWSLDDGFTYIDMMGEANRDLRIWGVGTQNYTVTENNNVSRPLQDQDCYILNIDKFNNQNIHTVPLISPQFGRFATLNQDLSSITIGAFINCSPKSVISVSIGYSYEDQTFGVNKVVKRFTNILPGRWSFISQTFNVPEDLDASFSVILEFEYIEDPNNSSTFFISGMSAGQWSEDFNSSSVGLLPYNLPESIYTLTDSTKVLPISDSCSVSNNGYNVITDNRLGLSSMSIPLVYGSNNSATVLDSNALSMVIPANGFMNKSGQFRNYTLEFWLRALPNNLEPYKILGAIGNESGVYVDKEFLTLKVGNYSASYYVGEWYRPMLINISLSKSRAVLFLNGESVIDMAIDESSISYPEMQIAGHSTDWIGIFGSKDIYPFEIDCISLYGYLFNNAIAKKHWVYGQAVQNPESLNLQYGGSSVNIDYSFAKYANNYSYPKHAGWSEGRSNNLTFDQKSLKTFKPDMPQILGVNSESAFLSAADSYQNEDSVYLKMQNGSFISVQDIAKKIVGSPKGIYATFKNIDSTITKQSLIKLIDKNTGDSFEVYKKDGYFNYDLTVGKTSTNVIKATPYLNGEVYTLGIDFDKVSKSYGFDVAKFFAKSSSLSMYIGGSGNNDSYSGHIYGFGIFNEYSIKSFSGIFNARGLILGTDDVINADGYADGGTELTTFFQFIWDGGNVANYATEHFINQNTSYSVNLKNVDDTVSFTISSSGSWLSNIPLSFFARNIKTSNGSDKYDLDFLQLNVDIPAPAKQKKITTVGAGWTYSQLKDKFTHPTQRTYEEFDNPLLTGYEDYDELSQNTVHTYKKDTDGFLAKTYVYFKEIIGGYSNDESYYTNIVKLNNDGTVVPGEEWINTKYEVADNTIIYPPQNIDFNHVSMFIEIKTDNPDVINKQVLISNLAISSMSLNEVSETPIGTRNAVDIYPYSKNKYYYNFKKKNPFSIYKGSTPHLYLTQNSGIKVNGPFDSRTNRGIEVPLNQNKVDLYRIIALQAFIKYDLNNFGYSPVEIFEIETSTHHLRFYAESVHKAGKRGKIYCINMKTGELEPGVVFYINGSLVREPVISINQWTAIGIYFNNQIDSSLNTSSLRINGPAMLNNISFYTSSRLTEILDIATRSWLGVRESGRLKYDWKYWEGSFRWFEALVLATQSFYGVDPSDIYNTYVGSTKLVIDDKSTIRANRYKFRVINTDSVVSNTINIA